MPPRPVVVSRRAVVGAALLGTAGCSLGSLDPSPDDPTLTPSGGPGGPGAETPPAATDDTDGDTVLVDGVLLALSTAHRAVQGAVDADRALRPDLAPLVRLHRTHAAELGGLRDPGGRAVGTNGSPRAIRARVVAAEQILQDALVAAAVQARSGALAQLLASMAAAVAQHRSLL